MRRVALLEIIEGHILLLLLFLHLALIALFNLNLVDDIERATVVTLQVCAADHED